MSKLVMVVTAIAVVLAAGVAAPVLADGGERSVAETVWYQGFLADVDTGDPIDGVVTVVATLYDAVVDGSILWGPETHTGTVVTEGWFNIELGATVSLVAFIDPPYYLELMVASEVLEPRQKLASVPMALRSAAADSGDGDWTISGTTVYREVGRVAIGTSVTNGLLTVRDDGNAATRITIENQNTGASSAERLSFSNEDGDVAYISCYDDDSAGYKSMMVIANNRPGGRIMLNANGFSTVMVDSTGNVGIGLSSPESKLDIDGTAEMLGFKLTTSPSDGYVLTSDASGVGTWQIGGGGGGDSDWTIVGDNMYAAVSGSLGIGTSTPDSKLHLVSNAQEDVIFESTENSASVEIIARTSGGVNDYLRLYKGGPTAGGTAAGIPLAGLGRVMSGVSSDGLMLQVASADPMYFVTNAVEQMRISSDGDVGIGTVTPGSKLDVDGTVEATGLKMTDSPTHGYALTSDASGTATWQPQHLVDVHDEETVTMIGGTATQFDDTQVSLTVPGPGYIICTSTVWVGINHANNTSADHLQLNHSTSPTDMGSAPTTVAYLMMASEPIGSYYRSFSVHSTHSIVSAGTYTYYLVGKMLSGQDAWDQFVKAQMTAVYYPR